MVSLPSRERELKPLSMYVGDVKSLSLPSRERELKHADNLRSRFEYCRRSPRGSVN